MTVIGSRVAASVLSRWGGSCCAASGAGPTSQQPIRTPTARRTGHRAGSASGLTIPPQRSRTDRYRWRDADGNGVEEEIDGLLAVCLQHEMDHLNGVLFIDHLSRLKRDMVLKKLAKARKERGLRAA